MKLQDTERAKEAMEEKLAEAEKHRERQRLLHTVPSHRGLGAFAWQAKRSQSVDNGELGRKVEEEETGER